MPQCPRCKGDMPLLSKVCPTCGFVLESETSSTAEEQIDSLEQCVLKIKQVPPPTFLTSLRDMLGIVVFLVTVYCLVMAYVSDLTIFKIVGGVFLVVLQYFIGRMVVSWFKSSPKKEFETIKNEFEYKERIARRTFGKSLEVSRQIDAAVAEMIDIDEKRRTDVKHIQRIWLVCGIVFLLFASGTISLADWWAGKEAENAEYGAFQKRIDSFVASAENSEYIGENVRLNLVKDMVADGKMDYAETFFFSYCQERIGDFECARAIVQGYLLTSDKEKAASFAAHAKLRYKSDGNKLKKMLK